MPLRHKALFIGRLEQPLEHRLALFQVPDFFDGALQIRLRTAVLGRLVFADLVLRPAANTLTVLRSMQASHYWPRLLRVRQYTFLGVDRANTDSARPLPLSSSTKS